MISDNKTNICYFSDLFRTDKRYKKSSAEVFSILDSFKITYKFLPNTRDIWARDYMPIQVTNDKFIEFRYDPDYLQGDSEDKETRELKTYPDIVCDSIGLKTIKSDIIVDGGNIVKAENTIILTDKIIWENGRLYSEKKLIEKLYELFEVEKVVLIPRDEECDYGHADGMLRFINPKKVLISGFYETADDEFKKLIINSLEKANLEWEWLRCSENESEDNIAYINFFQTQDLIIVPSLNRKEDNVAFEQISKYFPTYASKKRIAQANMTEVFRQDGALNCITWTIKT
jgi:agmatine deiminase